MAKQHNKKEAGQRYEFKKKQCKGLRFTLFQMYLKRAKMHAVYQNVWDYSPYRILHLAPCLWFYHFHFITHYCKQPSIPVHATRRSRPMPDSGKAKCSPNKSLWGSLKAFHGQ